MRRDNTPEVDVGFLYCDASSLTKDELSSVGFVLKAENGETLLKQGKELNEYRDSTQAEYEAIVYALSTVLQQYSFETLHVYSDSHSVSSVLNSNHPATPNSKDIEEYVGKIQKLSQSLTEFTVLYTPRKFNFEADRIATSVCHKQKRQLPSD